MQCQIETPDTFFGRNVPGNLFGSIRLKDTTPVAFDPEDLKGLREWVNARQKSRIIPEKKCSRIYSAPWRIG